MQFSQSVIDRLKHYIYLYIDPRNDEIFYVGKGRGNRAFSHLKDKKEGEKARRINDIRKMGYEPRIEILIHGIESDLEIKKIEASIIDLIGLGNLTNSIRGHGSREYGRMSIDQINSIYNANEVGIKEPSILININQSYYYGISEVELYDATRSAWVVGKDKENAEYAFAVYDGLIKEVYQIVAWFPNNSTFNVRKSEKTDLNEDRWEFVGKLANDEIRNKYINKNVANKIGPRNPITYINVKSSKNI